MKIALVTGANRGIGAHIANRLAASGFTVYAGTRANVPESEPTKALPRLRQIKLDVTDPTEPRRRIEQIIAECGRIDLLVNNAGVAWFSPAEEMSETVLRTTMETNFFGALRCTKAVLPSMRQQGSGCVIMVSSLAAAAGLPLESAYCASKSALEAYAQSVRHEVHPFGIKVAAIEPGITEGGLATSTADPALSDGSIYRPLLDHTFDYYATGQNQIESPSLISDAIERIVSDPIPVFRHRLGHIAPIIDELAAAPQQTAESMLREALQIEWWTNSPRRRRVEADTEVVSDTRNSDA